MVSQAFTKSSMGLLASQGSIFTVSLWGCRQACILQLRNAHVLTESHYTACWCFVHLDPALYYIIRFTSLYKIFTCLMNRRRKGKLLSKNKDMAPSLLHVHIHLLSSDWERHLWSPKYINFLCVCVWLIRRSLHFPVRVFPFFFLFII